jgi:cell division protein FtsW (lipid II flippase)
MTRFRKQLIHYAIGLGLISLPLLVLAQDPGNDAVSLAQFVARFINGQLIPLFILLALVYVIYAAVEFIREKEDSQSKSEKKQQMFWGIIGLFVILTIWSLVGIIENTFNIFRGGNLSG